MIDALPPSTYALVGYTVAVLWIGYGVWIIGCWLDERAQRRRGRGKR